MNKITFYVISYGGSGSYMIMRYLQSLGYNVHHIHSRKRPDNLTFVGNKNSNGTHVYFEWFNDIIIPTNDLSNYKVIFVYRNPIKAIYSRFSNPRHLKNVQCQNTNIKLNHIIESKKDLYGIQDFFENYTSDSPKNYKIYFVKYESFFDNIKDFNHILDIPNFPHKYPKEIQTSRKLIYYDELNDIYKSLIQKMDSMNFIEIL
jgi:hypothetical protein